VTTLTSEQKGAIVQAAKNMITEAIGNDISLVEIRDEYESEFAFHHNISFPQNIDRPIKFLSRNQNEVPSRICLRLLISAMEKGYHVEHMPVSDTHVLAPYLGSLGFSQRHHQNLLFDYVHKALTTEKCGLVEGGTGIGKTLAILANANELAVKHKQRVVISTNTISNINQYIDTYQDLILTEHNMQPLQIILGKGNFVSAERLLSIVEESEYSHYTKSVNEWVKQGGFLSQDNPLLPPYQLSEIERLCPDIPSSEIVLKQTDEDDKGMAAYRQQFDLTEYPSAIIICTHSMLCVDAKKRVFLKKSDEVSDVLKKWNANIDNLIKKRDTLVEPEEIKAKNIEIRQAMVEKECAIGEMLKGEDIGFLPQYDFLIVDEAHLLESAMSDALTLSISFRAIAKGASRLISAGKLASNVQVKLSASLQSIQNAYDKNTSQSYVGGEGSPLKDAIRDFCGSILNARGIKRCDEPWIDDVKQLQKHVNKAGSANMHLSISYSPIRHYPQAIMGSTNTSTFLSALWYTTKGSCCVSATLYFKKYLEYSASHFIEILNIPKHKVMTFEPITPKWLKDPVMGFYLPPPADMRFNPVSSYNENQIDDRETPSQKWQQHTANQIKEIFETSAGGVLVLMTSFADTVAISDILRKNMPDIVLADGEHTLPMQKEMFLGLSKAGKKPLWLALGSAWTGLDVNGKHIGLSAGEISEKDNVITDLIIPKIPFGLNMTLAHMIRKTKHYNRMKLEILDTAIRFKQGVGRLIRLEGQPQNRRIFLLDGRINDTKRKAFHAPIIQYIETFPKVKILGT
jgi:CRISPR type IV-associated DEAD/DEAH-box helicase Csf4